MMLTRSFRRTVVVTCGAVLGFALLYEATVFDSRSSQEQAEARQDKASPAPGLRLRFLATAYCTGDVTASGASVRTGIAAADPALLPVGSVVQIEVRSADQARHNGIYTVMDTGAAVTGRRVDLFMPRCTEAVAFGERRADVTVLRLGWNPQATAPSLIDALLRQRERARRTTPSSGTTPGAGQTPGTSPPPSSPR